MLRPRLALRSTLLALGVLVCLAPATLATSEYQAIVKGEACAYQGGAHGRGYVLLTVKVREVGWSGTNYFKIYSKFQGNSGVAWGTIFTWPVETSTHFNDDATTHYRFVTRRYDFKDDGYSTRIQMKVKFWSDSDGLLETITVNGSDC